jgi:hypothetical protein
VCGLTKAALAPCQSIFSGWDSLKKWIFVPGGYLNEVLMFRIVNDGASKITIHEEVLVVESDGTRKSSYTQYEIEQ